MTKEGMLDWSWLEISKLEWSAQRLVWEICRIKNLSRAGGLETTFEK